VVRAKHDRRAFEVACYRVRGYWTAGPHLVEPGLSRYIDLGGDGCGTVPDSPHHRAIAESGWDNTARFGDHATQLAHKVRADEDATQSPISVPR
jgi:hypothetical protein